VLDSLEIGAMKKLDGGGNRGHLSAHGGGMCVIASIGGDAKAGFFGLTRRHGPGIVSLPAPFDGKV
jgi:hypothetical protein